jgi:uncharacterized membrane protein
MFVLIINSFLKHFGSQFWGKLERTRLWKRVVSKGDALLFSLRMRWEGPQTFDDLDRFLGT